MEPSLSLLTKGHKGYNIIILVGLLWEMVHCVPTYPLLQGSIRLKQKLMRWRENSASLIKISKKKLGAVIGCNPVTFQRLT